MTYLSNKEVLCNMNVKYINFVCIKKWNVNENVNIKYIKKMKKSTEKLFHLINGIHHK